MKDLLQVSRTYEGAFGDGVKHATEKRLLAQDPCQVAVEEIRHPRSNKDR